jgi:membrane protein
LETAPVLRERERPRPVETPPIQEENATKPVKPSQAAIIMVAIKRLAADEAITLAGNIAFRTLFSAFPFLIFLTALAGFFGDADLAEGLVDFLLSVAPAEIIQPLAGEIRSLLTNPSTGLLSLGALITIWSAMAGVDSVRIGLNRAYNVKERRSVLVLYLISVLFVVATAFVLLALSVLIVAAPIIISFIETHAPQFRDTLAVFTLVRYPVAILLLTVALAAAHRLLPAKRLPLRHVMPGVLLTVAVWIALATVYAYYLANFSMLASFYAGLSGVYGALLFLYFAALILLLGGEVNRVIALRRASRIGSSE